MKKNLLTGLALNFAATLSQAHAASWTSNSYKVEALEIVGVGSSPGWVRVFLKNESNQSVSIDCPDGGVSSTEQILEKKTGFVNNDEAFDRIFSSLVSAAHTGALVKFRSGTDAGSCYIERIRVEY